MHERQYTRIDTVRNYLDNMLKECPDKEVARNGYVHLYGVGQACALISLKRGHDRKFAELAEVAGMLHDFSKYKDNVNEEHAQKSSVEAKEILKDSGVFTLEEIEMICHAIYHHSEKGMKGTELDEILKDADEMQHWLRNPTEEYWLNKERTQMLIQEFGLNG